MNRVIIIGNLTKDVELRKTSSGKSVSTITVAVNDRDKTVYVDCVLWDKSAENTEKYCGKGSKVGIEGRLDFQEWKDRQGNQRRKTVIAVERITFLSTKNKQEHQEPYIDYSEMPFLGVIK
mgnify:CR=1 FL=1